MSDTAVKHYIDELHRLQESLPGDKLSLIREAAMGQFQARGFPTTRQENWKYTDVKPIARSAFGIAEEKPAAGYEKQLELARLSGLESHELVFINGRFSVEHSRLQDLPQGVVLEDMSSALNNHSKLVDSIMSNTTLNEQSNPFNILNTAFIHDGVLIHVPDDCSIDKPINLIYLSGYSDNEFSAHPRNLIFLGNGARLTVIENYVGAKDSQYFINTVTDAVLASNAVLTHYKLQQESVESYHIGNFNIYQDRDSQVNSHSISLGGSLVRNDIKVQLDAEGAGVLLNGLYMANGKQHIDNHTLINHLQPHTNSEEHYRGVLNDRGRGVFNGKVVVHKDAQKTDAAQSNANLLLSDQAEIDTKPELEIYADDVKCSHGSTVGQLDKDMMFYLRSRAIDETTAKSILTFAFAEEVIKRIEIEQIRHYLEYQVIGRLPDAELIKEFTHE